MRPFHFLTNSVACATDEQYAEIKAARKANRDKRIDKRLQVLELRIEGKNLGDISAATGFAISHISSLIRQYYEEGPEAITENHYHGNRRNTILQLKQEVIQARAECCEWPRQAMHKWFHKGDQQPFPEDTST